MVWVLDDEERVGLWSVFWKMEKWNREGEREWERQNLLNNIFSGKN